MKYLKIIWCVLQALSGVLAIVAWIHSDDATLSAWLQLPAFLIGVGYGLHAGLVLIVATFLLMESFVRIQDAKQLREQVRSQRLRKARS